MTKEKIINKLMEKIKETVSMQTNAIKAEFDEDYVHELLDNTCSALEPFRTFNKCKVCYINPKRTNTDISSAVVYLYVSFNDNTPGYSEAKLRCLYDSESIKLLWEYRNSLDNDIVSKINKIKYQRFGGDISIYRGSYISSNSYDDYKRTILS